MERITGYHENCRIPGIGMVDIQWASSFTCNTSERDRQTETDGQIQRDKEKERVTCMPSEHNIL